MPSHGKGDFIQRFLNTIDSRHELDGEIREELADQLIEDVTGISRDEFAKIVEGKFGKKVTGKVVAKIIKNVTSLPVSVALKLYDILTKTGYVVASNGAYIRKYLPCSPLKSCKPDSQ